MRPWTPEQVAQAGERITNLQRVYSLKCGITGADDKLPKRLLQPTAEGGQEGHVPDIALQLREYYEVRGWDEKGRPTEAEAGRAGPAGYRRRVLAPGTHSWCLSRGST